MTTKERRPLNKKASNYRRTAHIVALPFHRSIAEAPDIRPTPAGSRRGCIEQVIPRIFEDTKKINERKPTKSDLSKFSILKKGNHSKLGFTFVLIPLPLCKFLFRLARGGTIASRMARGFILLNILLPTKCQNSCFRNLMWVTRGSSNYP